MFKLAPPPRLGPRARVVIQMRSRDGHAGRVRESVGLWRSYLDENDQAASHARRFTGEIVSHFYFHLVTTSAMHCYCILMSLYCIVVEPVLTRVSDTSLPR